MFHKIIIKSVKLLEIFLNKYKLSIDANVSFENLL